MIDCTVRMKDAATDLWQHADGYIPMIACDALRTSGLSPPQEIPMKAALLLLVLIALGGCESRPDCVVTPNDTVECN